MGGILRGAWKTVNPSFVALVHALLEAQRDVDFIDDGSLAKTLKIKGGALVNLSGQSYRAILVPPAVAISQAALDKLKAFAKAGGKVFFLGGVPQIVISTSSPRACALRTNSSRSSSW